MVGRSEKSRAKKVGLSETVLWEILLPGRPALRDDPRTARLLTDRGSGISDFEAQAEPTWRAALA